MRRGFALLIWLFLMMLHAPGDAQAVVFSLLPGFFTFDTPEPAMLLVTGIALIALARIGVPGRR